MKWEEECWKITSTGLTKIDALSTTQEETDTRMFLHSKMAELEGYKNVTIASGDTDLFVLAVCIASVSNITIHQKRGTAPRSRFYNISSINNGAGSGLLKCLSRLHVYTGCDIVSASTGKR